MSEEQTDKQENTEAVEEAPAAAEPLAEEQRATEQTPADAEVETEAEPADSEPSDIDKLHQEIESRCWRRMSIKWCGRRRSLTTCVSAPVGT